MRTVIRTLLIAMPCMLGSAACACAAASRTPDDPTHHVARNVRTSFSPDVAEPRIGATAFIHPLASVLGNVELGERVFVAPGASVRGDEGQPIHIGAGSNVQDGVVVHALETFDGQHAVEGNLVTVSGKRYAVFVGQNVSLAHQA